MYFNVLEESSSSNAQCRQLAALRTVPSSILNWPGYLYVFTLILLGSCVTLPVRQTQLQYVFLRQCHCNILGLSGIHFVFYLRVSKNTIWGPKIIDSTITQYYGQSYIMCFSASRIIAARYHLPFYLGWCYHNRKVWKQEHNGTSKAAQYVLSSICSYCKLDSFLYKY